MDSAEEKELHDLRYFLHVLLKHRVKFLSIFAAIVAGVTAWSFIMPWTYEAKAKIIVVFRVHNINGPSDSQPHNAPNLVASDTARKQRINAETERLKGRTLIARTIEDVGMEKMYPDLHKKYRKDTSASLMDRAVPLFQQALAVTTTQQPHVITITFRHHDPIISSQAVNRLIDRFAEHHAPARQSQTTVTTNAHAQKQHKKPMPPVVRDTMSAESLTEQKESLQKHISELEKNLVETRGEIRDNEGATRAIKAYQPGSDLPPQLAQEKGLNTDAMKAIRTDLARLRARERELRRKYTEKNAQVVSVRSQIDETQRLLAREEKIYLDNSLLSIQAALKKLTANEGTLRRNIAKSQRELAGIIETEERLAKQGHTMVVEAGNTDPQQNQPTVTVNVAEPATPPLKPIEPRISLNIALAVLLGTILGLGATFLSERLMPTFDNPGDVERHLGLTVLASITKTRP